MSLESILEETVAGLAPMYKRAVTEAGSRQQLFFRLKFSMYKDGIAKSGWRCAPSATLNQRDMDSVCEERDKISPVWKSAVVMK